jgi:hypothetical protein
MRNRLITGTLVAVTCSAALVHGAQHPRPSGQPVGAAPVARPSVVGAGIDTKKVTDDNATVVGCVQPGAGPKTFVLAESPSALAPVGDAAPATSRDRGARYELFTSDGTIDFAKLVGRQVEANGTLAKPAASSDEKKRTSEPAALSKFTAKAIRETGASC